MTEYDDAETAPFCGSIPDGSGSQKIRVTLPDGQGGTIAGYVTAEQARKLTLGLRAVAADIDGKHFFAGGWSKAEALRAIATDYTRLVEGDGSKL